MARKLVGQEGFISFTFGSFVNGTLTWGTEVPLMAYVKNWNINGSVRDTDTSALGDTRDSAQPLRGTDQISFDAMVPDTGPQFVGQQGTPIKIQFKPKATAVGSAASYTGFVSTNNYEVPDGVQMEKISIKVGLNGA